MARHITLGDLDLATPPNGVRLTALKLEGWDSSPAPTLSLTQKPRAHGAWRSADPKLTAKSMVLSGLVQAPSAAAMEATVDAVNAAFSLEETRLQVDDGTGAPRHCMVSRQDDVLWSSTENLLIKRFSAQVVAADPRKYGDELTGSTALPMSSGGLTVPFTVPFSINSTIGSGQVNLTNPGNVASNVRLRIAGPVSGPVVTHVNSGVQLVFSSSLTLAAGEWIDVDVEARTVLAQGQPGASRAGWVTSRGWALFEPGDNTWAFAAAAYDPDARLTVTASPSWL